MKTQRANFLILRFIFSILFCFLLYHIIDKGMRFFTPLPIIFLQILLGLLFLMLIFYNKKSFFTFSILAASGYLLFYSQMQDFIAPYSKSIYWGVPYLGAHVPFSPEHAVYFQRILVVPFIIISYFIYIYLLEFWLAFIVGIGFIIAFFHAEHKHTVQYLPYFFALLLSTYMIDKSEKKYISLKTIGAIALSVALLTSITTEIALRTPIRSKPFRFETSKVTAVYNLSQTGFQPNPSSLGGPISLNKQKVMEVKSDYRSYLRGAVKDTYEDNNWTSKKTYYASAKDIDLSRSLSSLLYNISSRKTTTMEIKYTNLNTKTLFIPYYPKSLSLPADHSISINANTEMISDKALSLNHSYKVNTANVDFASIYLATQGRNSNRRFHTLSPEERTLYTALPDSVPERVKNLALEITEPYDIPYNKAKVLQEYLIQSYPYSLSPKKPPGNRDFVDYFLFDEQKGYCTYFASSIAVMARAVGIPSRYVIGYAMPPNPNANNVYEITNEFAHAWAEVFIENIGWIPMEATPIFAPSFYGNSNITPLIDPSSQSTQRQREYLESIMGQKPEEIQKPEESPEAQQKEQETQEEQEEITKQTSSINKEKIKIIPLASSLLGIGILVGFILLSLYGYKLRPMLWKNKSNAKQIQTAYKYIFKYLKDEKQISPNIQQLYLKSRYSPHPVNKQEVQMVLDYYLLTAKQHSVLFIKK